VAALILAVIPAFAQDDSAGSPKSASPDQSPGLSAPTTGATVPRLVTFSGVVKNAGGKPVTGTVTVAFSLYEFSEGGSPLWVENQQVQPDVRCFREQPCRTAFHSICSSAVRRDGWEYNRNCPVRSSRTACCWGMPYALKAADAHTLGGRPATAYVTTDTLNAPNGASTRGERDQH